MKFTLDQLSHLLPNGFPLELSIAKADNQATVRTNRGFEFTTNYEGDQSFTSFFRSFRHYPDPVSINDQPVATSPFPNRSRVTLQTFQDGCERFSKHEPFQLSEKPEETPNQHPLENACISGILCHLIHNYRQYPYDYMTALPGPHRNWQTVAKVQLHPVWEVATAEVHLLQQSDKTNLPKIPHNSEIGLLVEERAFRQINRTRQHPKMPAPADQNRIFKYVLGNDNFENIYHSEPMPIVVNGTPVTIPKDSDSYSTKIAIAEALYNADHPMVPVELSQAEKEKRQYRVMTDYDFDIPNEPDARTKSDVYPADQIILTFSLQDDPDDTEYKVDAPLLMEENHYEDKYVRYVPARLNADLLGNYLFRGYLNETNCHSWDDVKEEARELEESTHLLATALLDNATEAFQSVLNKFANSFHTELEKPKKMVTERSLNGQITVTYRPNPKKK